MEHLLCVGFIWNLPSISIFRNVFGEASKADDVQFVLDVIAKVGEELPQVIMTMTMMMIMMKMMIPRRTWTT